MNRTPTDTRAIIRLRNLADRSGAALLSSLAVVELLAVVFNEVEFVRRVEKTEGVTDVLSEGESDAILLTE